ncbi:MAG: M28 family peptidase, partial [Pyrinomonadaceae bacterium]
MTKAIRFKTLVLVVSLLAAHVIGLTQDSTRGSQTLTAIGPALESIQADKILEHIKILASDKFEGRNTGSKGEILTVNYLVDQFKRAGLKPGNPDGTYVQKVPLVGFLSQPQIELSINGTKLPLKFMEDFVHESPRLRPHVSVKNSGVVFAGYGIVAPDYGWDDYKGVDVRNKLVILLGGEPSFQDKNDPSKADKSMFRGDDRTVYSTREVKNEIALKKGAAAVLFITDPSKSDSFSIFQTFARLEALSLRPKAEPRAELAMTGLLTIDAARRIFKACGEDFENLRTFAEKEDFKPVLTIALANLSIKTKLRNVMSQNVVARLDGSDPKLKSEYLIYTAHWDHLGIDKSLKGDQIYNGAIDNAIGTASLVEMSKAFAKVQPGLKRSVLFI